MRLSVLVSTLVAAVAMMTGNASAEVAVGDEAPAWKMVGSDGKTYSSDELKGKQAYVIAWYPKAFTGG